jgi:SAM-dependent MidA family methyltransferase
MQDELMEVFVDFKENFIEVLRPASEDLKNYLSEQNIILPVNYQTEINLQAIEWIRQIAGGLKTGFVITVDYGFGARDLYGPGRHSGTLACYKDQMNTGSPYCNIGSQDITAHVNFSALDVWGRKYGLECAGFTTQGHFLRSLGLLDLLRNSGLKMDSAETRDYLLQINTLLLNMGNRFKVLIQSKGKGGRTLTGLRLAATAP